MKINIELNTDNETDLALIVSLQETLDKINNPMVSGLPDPLPDMPEVVHPPVVPAAPGPVAVATAPAPPPPPVEPLYDPTAIPDDAPGEESIVVPVPKGELDEVGCPWDARIHAGTKTKTDSGKWKRRRGVDNDVFRTVMHEITDPKYAPVAAPEVAAADPAVPAPPVAATAGFGEQAGNGTVAWGDLVQKVMSAKVAESINQEQVDQVVAGLGVEGGFNAMASRPDLYPQFMIELNL